ncbi:hypothetical protein D3C76_794800 [compost metagenome]
MSPVGHEKAQTRNETVQSKCMGYETGRSRQARTTAGDVAIFFFQLHATHANFGITRATHERQDIIEGTRVHSCIRVKEQYERRIPFSSTQVAGSCETKIGARAQNADPILLQT